MGNRAVITTKDKKLGIYLHWNGGRDSVEGFLTFCKAKGFRNPNEDCYGWICLATVIGNFMGDGISAGLDSLENLDCDNGDNGLYVIDNNWDIVARKYDRNGEQQEYPLIDMLDAINKNQCDSIKFTEEEAQKAREMAAAIETAKAEKRAEQSRKRAARQAAYEQYPKEIWARGYKAHLVGLQPLTDGTYSPIYRFPGGTAVIGDDELVPYTGQGKKA